MTNRLIIIVKNTCSCSKSKKSSNFDSVIVTINQDICTSVSLKLITDRFIFEVLLVICWLNATIRIYLEAV